MRGNQKALHKFGFLSLAFCMVCFFGCKSLLIPKAAPSPITKHSGDVDLANLIESIRVKEGLAALAAALIVNGKIYSVAAVGTREYGTDN